MNIKKQFVALAIVATAIASADADTRPRIFVNRDVTTHILMPENIKMVDISTERIVGDQCADNMLRIKPLAEDSLLITDQVANGDFLGTVTLIGERHMAQYDLVYSSLPMSANSLVKVQYDQTENYTNPDIPMTEAQMANYAWAISNTDRKFHTIRTKAYGIEAQIYNIYSIGGFFFIDLVLDNKTKIKYDIAQMRISLSDKKETKATNSQTLELSPAYVLNKENSFYKHYRQVIVLPKLTYPEEKVLNIEISEDQISGRVITIPIQYEDILHADCFDGNKDDAYKKTKEINSSLYKQIDKLQDKVKDIQSELDKANVRLDNAKQKLQKKSNQYLILERKVAELQNIYNRFIKMKDMFPTHMADIDSDDDEDLTGGKLLSFGDN